MLKQSVHPKNVKIFTESPHSIICSVEGIFHGRHGKYVVTALYLGRAETLKSESTTFSLKIWKEKYGKTKPKKGELVILSSLSMKRSGLRADRVEKCIRPTSEIEEIAQNQRAWLNVSSESNE